MTADDLEAKRLRDLTRRLGFGDGITEPQADNDTIVRWFEERLAEASEWVESIRWQDACFTAGHEDPISCAEHEPVAAARAAALRDAAAALAKQPPKTRADYVRVLRLYATEPWRLASSEDGG